ncbi:TIGR00296 family protein [Candidatus Woesearchaeota archaeon]|nr:TIGR00296 family protein [Candidatus Woesearchaeota archaeon]
MIKNKKIFLEAVKEAILNPDFNFTGFPEKKGIFVTLKKHGNLRGCIGFIEPIYPLDKALVEASRLAAFEDPRFPVLKKEEVKDLEIEISILSKPLQVKNIKEIKLGRDGLIIEQGYNKGLLLPQVFTEFNITSIEDALSMTCEKAGLPEDAWKSKLTRIYRFEAEIISET